MLSSPVLWWLGSPKNVMVISEPVLVLRCPEYVVIPLVTILWGERVLVLTSISYILGLSGTQASGLTFLLK